MRVANEIDSIITALQQRFDAGYGVGLSGFEVEDGNDGHLLVMNHRKNKDYEVTVKFRHGEYKCKIDILKVLNYKDAVTLKTTTMVSDDPQEVVDWVIKTIAPSAKTIDINESRRPRGRMLKESKYEGYPYRVSDIDWKTDGEDVDLPDEVIVDVPEDIVENGGDVVDYISDYLSDTYGFLHRAFVVDGPLEDEEVNYILKEGADRAKKEGVSKINEWNWCAPSARELAKGLKDGVKELWESRDEGGCIHWPVYTDDNGTEFDIVLGWEFGYEDDKLDCYFDDGYAICYAIKCQEQNNAMQTDMEMDFDYPYDEESGETFDWGGHISRKQDYNKLAKELLNAAKAIVSDCARDDDYDEDE